MIATFYSCHDSVNKINKPIGAVIFSAPCKPFESISAMTPKIILAYNSAIHNVNYCYIDTFDSYYFVQPETVATGERMVLSLTKDVLFSNKDSILNSVGTAIRWNGGTTDIPDSKYPVSDDTFVQGISFNGALFTNEGYNYIIGVNG